MVNLSREKRRALLTAAEAVRIYESDLRDRRTTIYCEDGFSVEIIWGKGNFAHLCGLDYFIDEAKTIPGSARRFYDLLLGTQIDNLVKHVKVREKVSFVQKKSRVICRALRFDGAKIIADSSLKDIAIAFGNELDGKAEEYTWCIGLGLDQKRSTEEHPVYFPRSLRQQSALAAEIHEDGTKTHIITDIVTRI